MEVGIFVTSLRPKSNRAGTGEGLASLYRFSGAGSRRHHLAVVSFHANAVPELQIKKTPDAIVMVDATGAVLVKYALDGGGPEQVAFDATWFQQQVSDDLQLRPGKPPAPGGGKAEFLAIKNRVRQQILH